MKKKFIVGIVSLLLTFVPGTALSQLGPPFQPLQPPTTASEATQTQKYTSEQYKFSFDYPKGWKVQEQQGAVNVNEPQNLAWVTMWRITQNVDPQTYLQNIETQLKQQWQNYKVTSRSEVKIGSIDALKVEGEATSQGKVWIFTLLVLHQNNQAKFMVVSGIVKEQYANLSPVRERIFNSITLQDTGKAVTSQQTQQQTQTTQQAGDGSEGIEILRNLARGGNPPPLSQITPPSDWVHVSHPTIYMLKLIRPPDWKEEIMQDPSGYYGGIKIISSDNQASLYVYCSVVFGAVTLEEGIREGIRLLTGSSPQVDIVVEDDLHRFISAMWPGADARFIAFRYQDKVGALSCMIFPMSGATQVHLHACIGPKEKFDHLTKEVFVKVFGWAGAGGYITPAPRG